jgi:hypothetical protein
MILLLKNRDNEQSCLFVYVPQPYSHITMDNSDREVKDKENPDSLKLTPSHSNFLISKKGKSSMGRALSRVSGGLSSSASSLRP